MAVLVSVTLSAKTYIADPMHTSIGFAVKHLGLSTVRGIFKTFTTTFTTDEDKGIITALSADIDTASIDTRVDMRDNDLRSANFFDVKQFPRATYVMKSYKGTKAGGKVIGELTLHGVTKPVTLNLVINGTMADKNGKVRIAGIATAEINRSDFGIGKKGDMPVSEKVTLTIDIEAISQ
ncbi:MAG: YceI family protein [Spirochaetes bacterium]|nr:YceI family protein [Spirochaetota bacterium]